MGLGRSAGRGGVVGALLAAVACGGSDGETVIIGGSATVVVGERQLEVTVEAGGFNPTGQVEDIVAGEAGCAVAVGVRDARRGGLEAGQWASADCVTFRGPPPDPAWPEGSGLPSDDKSRLTGVAVTPNGEYISVGYTEERADDFPAEVNMFSGDVRAWRRVEAPKETGDRYHQAASDIAITAEGTVLVVGVDGTNGEVPVLWRSTELAQAAAPEDETVAIPAAWERIELPLPSDSPDVLYAGPTEIVQTDDGRIVIVGRISRSSYVTEVDPGSWVSTDDGLNWAVSEPTGELSPGGAMGELAAVAEHADGPLLAVGRCGDNGCLWRSDDGLTWSTTELPGVTEETWLTDVQANNHGALVVGTSAQGKGIAWYSTEGSEWTTVPLPDTPPDVAMATDTGFLVIGEAEAEESWTAHIQVTEPTDATAG